MPRPQRSIRTTLFLLGAPLLVSATFACQDDNSDTTGANNSLGTDGPTDQGPVLPARQDGDATLGKQVFRFETFGNERFWTDALKLPAGSYELVRGWFQDTVPELAQRLADEGIALLRLDGDWYDSTMVCLEHLVPLLHEEGVVILDDYYAWDGCARATHDYLSRHDLPYRIRTVPGPPGLVEGAAGAYLIKRAHRTGGI